MTTRNLNLTWRDVVLRQYNADYDAGCPFPLRYLINATPWKRDIFIEVHEKIDKKVFRRAFLDFFLAQHKGEPVCKNEYISVYPRPRAEEFIVDHGGGGDDKKKREEKNGDHDHGHGHGRDEHEQHDHDHDHDHEKDKDDQKDLSDTTDQCQEQST